MVEFIKDIGLKFQEWFLIQRQKFLMKELAKIPSDNIDDYYFDNLSNQFIYKDTNVNVQIGLENILNVIKTRIENLNVQIENLDTWLTSIDGHQVDMDVNINSIKDLDIIVSDHTNKAVIREGTIGSLATITEVIDYDSLLFNRIVVMLHNTTANPYCAIRLQKRNADDSDWITINDWELTVGSGDDVEKLFSFDASEHFRVQIENYRASTNDYKILFFFSKKFTDDEIVSVIENTGLNLASGKVITSADENLSFILGRSRIGLEGTTDVAHFGHRDFTNWRDIALTQYTNGYVTLNCKTGQQISFRCNGNELVNLSASLLTMNIPILLPSAPTLDLHASTKKYVDDNIIGSYTYGAYVGNGSDPQTINANTYKDIIIMNNTTKVCYHKRYLMTTSWAIDMSSGLYTASLIEFDGLKVSGACNTNMVSYHFFGVEK